MKKTTWLAIGFARAIQMGKNLIKDEIQVFSPSPAKQG